MTLRECQLAAYWRIPVESEGLKYIRISEISIRFKGEDEVRKLEDYEPKYAVTLEAIPHKSYTTTSPKNVFAREPETFAQRVAEYNRMKGGEPIGG